MNEIDPDLVKSLLQARAKLDAAVVPPRTDKQEIEAILKANGLLPIKGGK